MYGTETYFRLSHPPWRSNLYAKVRRAGKWRHPVRLRYFAKALQFAERTVVGNAARASGGFPGINPEHLPSDSTGRLRGQEDGCSDQLGWLDDTSQRRPLQMLSEPFRVFA